PTTPGAAASSAASLARSTASAQRRSGAGVRGARGVRVRVVAALTGLASLLRRRTGAPAEVRERGSGDGAGGADLGAASTSAPDRSHASRAHLSSSILRDAEGARGRGEPPVARYARYPVRGPGPTCRSQV